MSVIVKVQRSIFPPDQQECLVYEKRKAVMSNQPIPLTAMDAMLRRPGVFAFKAYFEAEWDKKTGTYKIGSMVGDQPW